LHELRHSLAHVLASAVLEMFPKAQLGVGPVIDNGFYYDFLLPRPLTPEDIKKLEKRMRELVKQKLSFDKMEMTSGEAKGFFTDQHQPFKIELIKDIEKFGTTKADEILNQDSKVTDQSAKGKGDDTKVTLYKTGKFIDLCRGGHAKNTSEIDPQSFKLDKISGAYWRGDQANAQMQRVYGLAFETKAALDEYLLQREEAEKRDHKVLMKQLGLVTFSPVVGSGLPLYMPKGTIIRNAILDYMTQLKAKNNYKFVWTPHLGKDKLYEQSGHLGKYDAMLPAIRTEGENFILKPMNCPHHFQIYLAEPHSYKDFPIRLAENATDYRNEKSGELNGLFRVRSLTQDDTHHFVRHDQIAEEIDMILEITKNVFKTFGFNNFRARISTRGQQDKSKYFGTDDLWDKAEKSLLAAVKRWGVPYFVGEGEAAFYGPKIDVMIEDALGREWQLTTVQLDYVQPENFDMEYVNEKGEKSRPAVLHVAVLGSLDRFMGIVIEHFAGAFPAWLAPVQVKILPISDKQNKYSRKIYDNLAELGIRVELDDRTESVGKKIREAEMQKVPYMLIIGEKEMKAKKISVRGRNQNDLGAMKLEKFADKLVTEILGRKL
jgi:threonyl-tRNA synthetase